MAKMRKRPRLIPPDRQQCQVIKYNPFTMGGSVRTRCTNKPDFILKETIPGEDGQKGSQSCCKACRKDWVTRTGNPNVDDTWKWEKL